MPGIGAIGRMAYGGQAGGGPSDRALHRLTGWYAIALRLVGAVAFALAGLLAATTAVHGRWLVAVLVALCGWSVLFAWLVRRHGLTVPVVLADAIVIVILLSAHHLVVPAAMISAGTTWMLPLASTAVFITQLAFPPVLGLPVAAVVTVAYSVTVPHPADAAFLVIQAVVTAALVSLVRRGGRNADAVIARQLRAEQEMKVAEAQRADQREQFRRLHDTILSTLTMIASGALERPSPVLSVQASRDMRVLRALPALPGAAASEAMVSLGGKLRQVAADASPLRVTVSVPPAADRAPAAIADRLADCAAEALRNVSRHAGTDRAQIRVAGGRNGDLVVEIIDHGKGFDAPSVPRSRRGISESIRGRMTEVGGSAVVSGRPGEGTTVTLCWPA
jgi:signal transduction histidine kinase